MILVLLLMPRSILFPLVTDSTFVVLSTRLSVQVQANIDRPESDVAIARIYLRKVIVKVGKPGAHSIFDGHTVHQHKLFKGLGDKCEDFIESSIYGI